MSSPKKSCLGLQSLPVFQLFSSLIPRLFNVNDRETMNRTPVIYIALLTFAYFVSAQTISLSGRVADAAGNPIPGAIVRFSAVSLACTTKIDGTYLLSTMGSAVKTAPSARAAVSAIRYANGSFVFTASVAGSMRATLHDLRGKVVAEIFNGRLAQGERRVSFPLDRFGDQLLLLRVQTNGASVTYRFNLTAGGAVAVTGSAPLSNRLSKTAATTSWLQVDKNGYAAQSRRLTGLTGVYDFTLAASTPPDFGANVKIFDPSMSMSAIQAIVDSCSGATSHFSNLRTAYFFKPGKYSLTVNITTFIQAYGLGMSPDSTVINGFVQARAEHYGSVLGSFWRGAENLFVVPPAGQGDYYATSQAAPFRRMHVKSDLYLSDGGASGGFISDCKIDGTVRSGAQQQYYFRNSAIGGWNGAGWNMFFQGVDNAPASNWPVNPNTVIPAAPVVREKPFITIDGSGNYAVFVPSLSTDAHGVTWAGAAPAGQTLPIDQFFVARAGIDDAASMNAALGQGKNLLLTPGIYHLASPLLVERPSTVVLGLGMATLVADSGTIALKTADAGGITIANILFDAGADESPALLQIGDSGSAGNHATDPICLFDIICRIGGPAPAKIASAVVINSNNTILDHCWIWRADHGAGAGWEVNPAKNGLVVNGNDVITYGQMVEHFQGHQTVWNGENGRTYFYQCELPYDPPAQSAFIDNGNNGFSAYYVAPGVKKFEGWGIGVYAFFEQAPVVEHCAVEVPDVAGVKVHHIVTLSLYGNQGEITHPVNNYGPVTGGIVQQVRVDDYPPIK
jgi:hypothetical protein